jgi:hypothetical protein
MGTVQHYGLDDFFEAAWELVPYSFVVDWFTNLAVAFDIMPSTMGVVIKGHWTVSKIRSLSLANCVYEKNSSYTVPVNEVASYSGSASASRYWDVKLRTTGYGSPDSYKYAVEFKNTLNLSKTLDLLAIESKFI